MSSRNKSTKSEAGTKQFSKVLPSNSLNDLNRLLQMWAARAQAKTLEGAVSRSLGYTDSKTKRFSSAHMKEIRF